MTWNAIDSHHLQSKCSSHSLSLQSGSLQSFTHGRPSGSNICPTQVATIQGKSKQVGTQFVHFECSGVRFVTAGLQPQGHWA